MARKRRDYFGAGVKLVWEIDPETRTADVYTGPEEFTTVAPGAELDGGARRPSAASPDTFA
jgi:hypothetical protein